MTQILLWEINYKKKWKISKHFWRNMGRKSHKISNEGKYEKFLWALNLFFCIRVRNSSHLQRNRTHHSALQELWTEPEFVLFLNIFTCFSFTSQNTHGNNTFPPRSYPFNASFISKTVPKVLIDN